MLTELSFPRIAINDNEFYGLHIFCDSSTETYGFVMYACTNEKVCSFLFAKSELAPLRNGNEHSLPTLELMGVILASKCLPTLIETYKNIHFQFINGNSLQKAKMDWIRIAQTENFSKEISFLKLQDKNDISK